MEGGTAVVSPSHNKATPSASTSSVASGSSTASKNALKQILVPTPSINKSDLITGNCPKELAMSSESASSSVASNGTSSKRPGGKQSQTTAEQGERELDSSQAQEDNLRSKQNGAKPTSRQELSTPPPPPQAAPNSPYHPHVYYTGNPPYYSYPNPNNGTMSPSSSPTPSATATANYDLHAAFLQQQQAQGALFGGRVSASNLHSANGNASVIPLSPQAGNTNGTTVIPPSSPIFTAYRMENFENRPGSSMYMQSPAPGNSYSAGMYYQYENGQDRSNMSASPPYGMSNDRSASMCLPSQLYSPQLAPQIQQSPGGIPPPPTLHYPPPSGNRYRAPSIEEMSLPPPLSSDDNYYPTQQHLNGASHTTAATLFAHQQQWGYPPPSPSQAFNSQETPVSQGGASNLVPPPSFPFSPDNRNLFKNAPSVVPFAHNGHSYYQPQPPSTPGPPIQTTASNKGPDGANLFIFHIPNHFSNLDMYHLFCHYGTLLSVRIMVEKDTGRSRGFGFVSYDCPESAALAIKELNGFVIGNKRLKVQHKQIKDTPSNSGSQSSYNTKKQNTLETVSESTPSSASSKQQNRNWYNNTPSSAQPTYISPEDSLEHKEIMKSVGTDDAYVLPNEVVHQLENGASAIHVVGGSTLEDMKSLKSALPDLSD